MSQTEKPDYGNWVPGRMMIFFLVLFCISLVVAIVINITAVRIILIIASVGAGFFLAYLEYAYWLLWKNDGELQKKACNLVIEKIEWDGKGKALDIGTGSGRIAIYCAKKYPSAQVIGIDFWGNPWTYSKGICDRNAEAEGVADGVNFQKASAVELPFEDGEFDLVVSNYVFHSIKTVKNEDRISLVKEALRVLKDGGAFAFQDLFNKQFYDMDQLYEEVRKMGLKKAEFYNTSDSIHIPLIMRPNHMMGNSKIICGIK